MAGANLLALIDDIASMLDDVSAMTKVATKKTAGVLGDDLALNAQQVSGVRAERELPVVWAVAKGSFKNKFILVPGALLISAVAPWAIKWLLMIGGLFLCFEGFEKIVHHFAHKHADAEARNERVRALADEQVNLLELEKTKIKGAIRTDFILSAEIVVIALGTVQGQDFNTQVLVVSTVALLVTACVYGLVAAIVKLDDFGLLLIRSQSAGFWGDFKHRLGRGVLAFCPYLMKTLSVLGTAAMFLVGGGILVHGIPGSHEVLHHITESAHGIPAVGDILGGLAGSLINGLVGLLAGAVVLAVVSAGAKMKKLVTA